MSTLDATGPARAPAPATCRMFETPLLEFFSRIHPATPFLFWIPVLAWILTGAARDGAVQPQSMWWLAMGGLVVLGALLWSLTEYLMHRFVFHAIGARPWQRRMYFVAHGVHHDFPADRDRLVMPLGVSIPLGLAFYGIFRVLLGAQLVAPLFVGFGAGYLAYDGIHYAVHHFRLTSRAGRWLKRWHMVHHHTGEDARWGVTSPLWDWVFGTMGGNASSAAASTSTSASAEHDRAAA